MHLPAVYIIVLNFNGSRWLKGCFEALRGTGYANLKVLLVDNASTDDSLKIMEDHFPEFEVFRAESNLGFSEGNNIGIRKALDESADYVVLLNPDTRVTPGWLDKIIEVGEENPHIGVLGAVQLSYDSEDFNTWTRTAFPRLLDILADTESAPPWISVEWVEGACMAVKREVLEKIGLLDPIYFAFYEEIDFCRRASCSGYEIALVPRSRIHHHRGGSWQANAVISRERDYRCDRSQFIFNMTDPRKSLFSNLKQYLITLATKVKSTAQALSAGRAIDLFKMQIDLLANAGGIFRKWRSERRNYRIAIK